MKTIALFLIFGLVSLYAKPCMTDIYFGNGVWNTDEEGQEGRDELKFFMQNRANTRLDIQKEGIDYDFKHAYNPSSGTRDDLIETFYQLKDSGQISNDYFQWIFVTLNTDERTEPYEKLQNIIRTYNDDASYMFTKYENESFNQKHNVLLVAHSQGNLFGNKMYTLMNDTQKEKFRMVSVATPADHVAGGGPYVTASGDYVIVPIPGSLSANVIGFGHTFLGTYLNIDGEGVLGDGSDNAPKIIGLHVKSAYDDLIQTATCDIYDTVYLTMEKNEYTRLNVMGTNRENTPDAHDTLLSSSLEQLPATYDVQGNASCPYWESSHLCAEEFNATHCTLNLSERERGMILSPLDIADYQYFKLSMLHDGKCATIDIADSIYGAVRDALQN